MQGALRSAVREQHGERGALPGDAVYGDAAAVGLGQLAPTRPPEAGTMHDGDMDAMHEQMRDQMSDDVQARCDTMHAQGGAMTGGGMMTGGMGGHMMGGDMTPQR
jgi:hypothetical protein